LIDPFCPPRILNDRGGLEQIQWRALTAMVNESAVLLDENIAERPSDAPSKQEKGLSTLQGASRG
jgi:hypothetical protein